MRERLDCVILGFGDMADWCKQKAGVYAKGRLHVHRLHQPDPADGDIHALAAMAVPLQRFDACLLAICGSNLAWVRQAMLVANAQMRTPIIGLVHNIQAPALGDLYNLGMADFVREPVCAEEIRIRIERLLDKSHVRANVGGGDANPTASHVLSDCGRYSALTNPFALGDRQVPCHVHSGGECGDAELEAFAIASASRCATSNDSFGVAKSKVIGCFERAYLLASLAKSSGNIAMAARGAKKHRRAYWALMRKYDIDAAPFRTGLPPDQ